MLVLTRHQHEQIMIGDNVRIKVLEIRGNRVIIGIDAPKNVPVHRLEVYDAVQQSGYDKHAQLEAETPTV